MVLFYTDWSLDMSFILRNERFKIKRTMYAKLFGVKAPFSSKVIAQNPKTPKPQNPVVPVWEIDLIAYYSSEQYWAAFS